MSDKDMATPFLPADSKKSSEEKPTGHYETTGHVFSLVGTALGIGCLAIPAAFAYTGIVLGSLVLILSALVTRVTLISLAVAVKREHCYHFPTLAEKVMGTRLFNVLVLVMFVFFLTGIMVGYFVVIGDLSLSVLGSTDLQLRMYIQIGVWFFFVLPITFFKDFSVFKKIAPMSLITLVYATGLLMAQSPYYIPQNDLSQVVLWKLDSSVFNAISICVFAYFMQQNIFSVQQVMKNPPLEVVHKIIDRTLLALFSCYAILGVVGYLNFFQDMPDLFIQRQPPRYDPGDFAMTICRALFVAALIVGMTLNFFPCRATLYGLVMGDDKAESKTAFIFVTILLNLVTITTAIFVPDILSVLNVLGGGFGLFNFVLLPAAFYVRLSSEGFLHWQNLSMLALCTFMAVSGFISIANTVMGK